jgi:type I restriction enzyme S subunit
MMTAPAYRKTAIREIAHVNARSINARNAPSHIEYVDISSVGTGEFIESPKAMSFADAPSRARRIVKAGDTILSTVRPNRRSFLFLSAPSPIAVASTGFAVLTPTAQVDARYLYYWVTRQDFTDYLSLHAKGAAYPAVSAEDIGNGEIDIPPLQIQQRIAGILSAYDELIENSQRRIKTLESMARAIYREWFVHFRFPGHESGPRVPSPLGDIPQGWEIKKMGDLCTLTKDVYRDASHSELPLLDLARMPSRTLAPRETGKVGELTTSRITFQPGDTLFGAIRCYLHKVVVMHYPGVTNTSVLVLRPKKAYFRSLLAIIASDVETIRWAETQSTGTKMPVIKWEIFQNMATPIPAPRLADEYERLVGPMLDEMGALATQIQYLRRTRDLLLPRLLSGELDVKPSAA